MAHRTRRAKWGSAFPETPKVTLPQPEEPKAAPKRPDLPKPAPQAIVIATGFWGYHAMPEELRRKLAIEIIAEVAAQFQVTIAEIKGPRRTAHIIRARQWAMWRVHKECPHLSLPRIGKAFGGKDHTTVLHATRKIGKLLEQGLINDQGKCVDAVD